MTKGTLTARVERVEQAAMAHPILSADCICFPEDEQPFFCSVSEEAIAATVKCPLHGERFVQPIFHIYVPQWRRESEPARRESLPPQYRKAWVASCFEESRPLKNELEPTAKSRS
jgi:hypothetical protein